MNDAEHANIVDLEKRGKLVVGVDRPIARSFFTRMSISDVKEATGYAPYLEKSTIRFFFLLAPLALVVSVIVGAIAFGWWELAIGPLCVATYLVYQMMSARGGARARLISILLVLAAAVYFLNLLAWRGLTLVALVYVLALWSIRMMYVSSTVLYRNMALNNAELYTLLREGIVLRELP